MAKILAYCGLSCDECGAYIATVNDDDAKRAEMAETWSKEFNGNLKPSDINCVGCLSTEEPLFMHCKVCEIRKCGIERGVENCAHCDDYACDQLVKFFEMAPPCREALERIRNAK